MSNTLHRLCTAPMMDWSDRHCRYYFRLLAPRARLYTEMVTTGALLHGDVARHLRFHRAEHPLALQLGGSDPEDLARCAEIAATWGYDEINLNCGCPSERVQRGAFGACLMAEPARVADGVSAMKAAVKIPVTVKCRIGIDDQDEEEALDRFADAMVQAGADALVVHARKAWLQGLSPRENRDIPPLNYDRVVRLKQRLGGYPVILNGGVTSLADAKAHLANLDGVMVGRAAYDTPEILLNVDQEIFGETPPVSSLGEAFERLIPYIERELASGTRLHDITKHLLGAFRGRPGARAFRRHLATEAVKPGANAWVLREALSFLSSGMPAQSAA
ncbi:MAG: tRNA dihydrouridine(20/20a) synthase DusA [Burkholderiales bacterium]|nr:tRNA dihydrouridine(20/20a) synthase DusA [Burkholderiales bacterium]MCW5622407.1 tRNA dihydrouridine(20/20a) synthase DusA [Burkholderiales bacterium]